MTEFVTGQLSKQSWMTSEETVQLMKCLEHGGADARFVGGCVRDALLGRSIGDIDIAINVKPERVQEILDEAGIRNIPTGLKHGTITAVINHIPYEITTLRKDIETDGRHAVVQFTDDWKEDAARRDFTMNALSLAPDGTVIDYFGGINDAKTGHIRFVGNAKTRLEEDVLRLLRYFRFYAYYGKGQPDAEAIAACEYMAPRINRLAAERVRVELLKLFKAPNPIPAITLMRQSDIFETLSTAGPIHFDELSLNHLERLMAFEATHDKPDPIRRLACLFYDRMDEKTARHHADALRFSNDEKTRFVQILSKSFNGLESETTGFYQHYDTAGPERMIDDALVGMAVEAPGTWTEWIAYARATGQPEFSLRGRDVQTLGLEPGRGMGRALAATRSWWVDQGFKPDRDACMAWMKDYVATMESEPS